MLKYINKKQREGSFSSILYIMSSVTSYTPIERILIKHGPMRSARLAEYLAKELSLTNDAARKQISRENSAVMRLGQRVLPKNEAFLYREDDWNTERYWTALLNDMRETNSVYGMTVDGLMARGGIAQLASFKVVTGAPVAQKGQVPLEGVVERLLKLGFIEKRTTGNFGDCIALRPSAFEVGSSQRMRARLLAESVLLDALHQWSRNLGFGSYNKIDIREGAGAPKFGTFLFDLVGPSYLMPLTKRQGSDVKPGFFVADVFCDGILTRHQIQYFLRKVLMLRSMRGVVPFLPLLLADGFTADAFKAGKSTGIVMATSRNLFGASIAASLASLLDTLENAAAVAAANPDKITTLLDSLKSIEGSAGNVRGALFELIVGHLVREVQGNTIDIGEIVRDPKTGEQAEIDVRRVKEKQECWFYECRGRPPTHQMPEADVEKWITRINRILNFHRAESRFQNCKFGFELWTTGGFDVAALARLKAEKQARSKITISWRDGPQVREYAKKAGAKSIINTLDAHYFTNLLDS